MTVGWSPTETVLRHCRTYAGHGTPRPVAARGSGRFVVSLGLRTAAGIRRRRARGVRGRGIGPGDRRAGEDRRTDPEGSREGSDTADICCCAHVSISRQVVRSIPSQVDR